MEKRRSVHKDHESKVWYPYMYIYIIVEKVINIKSVDLTMMSAKKKKNSNAKKISTMQDIFFIAKRYIYTSENSKMYIFFYA